jgi:hypothetical protein
MPVTQKRLAIPELADVTFLQPLVSFFQLKPGRRPENFPGYNLQNFDEHLTFIINITIKTKETKTN